MSARKTLALTMRRLSLPASARAVPIGGEHLASGPDVGSGVAGDLAGGVMPLATTARGHSRAGLDSRMLMRDLDGRRQSIPGGRRRAAPAQGAGDQPPGAAAQGGGLQPRCRRGAADAIATSPATNSTNSTRLNTGYSTGCSQYSRYASAPASPPSPRHDARADAVAPAPRRPATCCVLQTVQAAQMDQAVERHHHLQADAARAEIDRAGKPELVAEPGDEQLLHRGDARETAMVVGRRHARRNRRLRWKEPHQVARSAG